MWLILTFVIDNIRAVFGHMFIAMGGWGWQMLSVIVLAFTAWVIADQARSTRKMVEAETRPVVDVLVCNGQNECSLQFINKRPEVPALVWLTIGMNGSGVTPLTDDKYNGNVAWHVFHSLYQTNNIAELESARKAATGENEVSMTMKIDVAPVWDQRLRKQLYSKTYKVNGKEKKWQEVNWGIFEETIKIGKPRGK